MKKRQILGSQGLHGRIKVKHTIAGMALLATLVGCGQKGPLYLPTTPQAAPHANTESTEDTAVKR